MWVNRHKLNNSLVVFIHGIFGERWATWKGVPDLLQRRFLDDPLIRSYDFYLFEYQTSLLRQPALSPFVVGSLKDFLRREQSKYQTAVLIGHSQGGLLAKLYLLDALMAGAASDLVVDLVITLGTPHRGVFVLNPLYLLQQTWIVGRFVPFKQLGQLASWSRNIRTLKANWGTCISPQPCPPTASLRHVRTVAVIGAYDVWVTAESAAGYADTRRYLTRGHPGLAKPHSESDALAELILEELRAHQRPTAILESVRTILSDGTARDAYLTQHAHMVADEVQRARPSLGSDGTHTKTASILMDFLYDFPERPLRGLPLGQALKAYTERQMQGEL